MVAAVVLVCAAAVPLGLHLSSGPSYPKAWDPRVAPIAAFDARDRGLAWKHPIAVEFLTPAAFVAKIGDDAGAPTAADRAVAALEVDELRALGLLHGNLDLLGTSQKMQQNDIIGMYVPADGKAYVRGDQLTPAVRVTLAHELTHALQDQYFGLAHLKAATGEAGDAATALIEGDAVRVQRDYLSSLPASQQQEYLDENNAGASAAQSDNQAAGVPALLSDAESFPYDLGPTFVQALLTSGGNPAVDAAFRAPPTSDAQIVNPSRYLDEVAPVHVPLPHAPKGDKVFDTSAADGEVALQAILGNVVGYQVATRAAQGVAGDASIGYHDGGRVCVDLDEQASDGSNADRLLAASTAWAATLPGATASLSGVDVHLHSCDPGPHGPARPALADPYVGLADRAELIAQFSQAAHLNATTSECTADWVLAAVGIDQISSTLQSDQAPDNTVVAAVHAGVAACRAGG